MGSGELNRRDFQKLTAAALGGLVAGASLPRAIFGEEEAKEEHLLIDEPHVCRGLNACKGVGKGGENTCAGQGNCATAKAHSCHAANECKGQGGCGETAGENACKAQGECAVPLGDDCWKKTRKRFEEAMKAAGKKFGDAPAKAE